VDRTLLHRHELVPRGRLDHQPPSLSWDYLDPCGPCRGNLALITCPSGHVTRLVSSVHRVENDGTVHPSYVCTVRGCGFHVFIRLVGWTPDRPPDGPPPQHQWVEVIQSEKR
jgi:hypothetical protein